MTTSIIEHFSALQDHRIERNKRHSLIDIIVLSICAICSGAEGWEAIEDFGREKEKWLKSHISLKNGIPSHDCIAYTLRKISPTAFQECFISWVNSVKEQTEGEIIAIDGKTARGSRDKKNNIKPLHMVNAWACSNRLVLAQEATDEKSNEITAIPKLLSILELKGCIVTIDAMGCQRAIVSKIIDQEADYVIGLKGNQGTLHEEVKKVFKDEMAKKSNSLKFKVEKDKGHGRREVRTYWISDELDSLSTLDKWKGLKSIGMVRRECFQGSKYSVEERFFINSINADPECFAGAVRGHWDVENRLHWRLDVIFGDDLSRIKKGNGAAIMTSIKHICLNLFEQEGSSISMAKKRRKAAWSDKFRSKVLFS